MIYISLILLVIWIFIMLIMRSKMRKISKAAVYDKSIPSEYTNKIEVVLDKCTIKQGEFYFNLSDPGLLTTMDNAENKDSINKRTSVVIYRLPLPSNQFEEYVSPIIFKDEVTLSFLLDKQKKTYIYVNPDDKSKYFFDLRFLFNK